MIFLFILVGLMDLFSALVIFWGMDNGASKHYGFGHKLGRWILSVGLLYEVGKIVQMGFVGNYPSDLGVFLITDIGIFVIILAAMIDSRKRHG